MKETTKKLTWSAMFIALGLVLPFLTGQIPQFGNMLLPMHICPPSAAVCVVRDAGSFSDGYCYVL